MNVVSAAKEKRVRTEANTAAEEEIMELERKSCRMLLAGELDPMIDVIIANDGLLFASDGGIVDGKEAQRAMFKGFLEAGYAIEFEPCDAFVSDSADMAWAYGVYRLTTPDGAEDVGKYVSVWARENGEWRNVAEMRNSGI